jgi:hypothetical protein
MIPEEVRTEIVSRLVAAEAEHGVRILLAIESGSRAWGFPSANSDYDVRFVYARPPGWYRSIDVEDRRDVIEYRIEDAIDLNGWDLRKGLRLLLRSNPGLIEWIQSPITYVERGVFRARALEVLPVVYAPEKGFRHYRSMAKTNYRESLRQEIVPLKKYFYALRALLAARWVREHGTAPPIVFERLLALIEGEETLLAEIHRLLEEKQRSPELGLGPRVPALNAFIEAELEDPAMDVLDGPDSPAALDQLNALFEEVLREGREEAED